MKQLAAVGLTVSAVVLGPLAAQAQKTVNVTIDHNQYWAGYQTSSLGDPYNGNYLGAGGAPDIQGTITATDVIRCAPDLRMDKLFHTDLNIWADATGLSAANGGVTVDSTFYVDSPSLAVNGDTVIFSGQLVTNGLAADYSGTIVAFIKDFDSGWGWHGMTTVYLSDYANGDTFQVSKVITGDGSHIQYGFEWVGPPARTNPAAATFADNLGYLIATNFLVTDVAGIAAINPNPAQVQFGNNVTLTATTTGSSLTYQWSKNGVVLSNGAGISGATTNALTLSHVQGTAEGTYTLVVNDTSGNWATSSVPLYVFNPSWLYYDRAYAPYSGYINVWNGTNVQTSPVLSGSGGTRPKASFGFGVTPTTLLRASVNTNTDVITLQPNTYVFDGATNAMDPAYINPDGSSAAYMEQDFFIQNNALVGNTLVFAGYCSSNSLDPKYTATAWVKVSQDWSVEYRYDTNLIAGKPFVLTVPSSATTNMSFIQYGYAIWGPANSGTNPITEGAVEIRPYSPIAATAAGGNINLSFPTYLNHSYTVQYKTNLTDGAWLNLGSTNGNGGSAQVPDATSGAHRFYRLQTQ